MSTRSVVESLEARSLLSVAPSNLAATALSPTQLRLSWTDNTTIETRFLIDRSLDGVTWVRRTNVDANVTSFIDTQVEQGTTYHYRVLATAANWRDNSDWSSPAVGTTQLVRPTDVAANAIWSTIARVTWTDNSANETGFLVSRSSDGKNWVQVAAATAGATTATDRTAEPGTKYDYRVKAIGTIKAANSDWSAGGTTVTLGTAAPTDARAMSPNPTTVWVNWTDQSWNETHFNIDRSTDGATWLLAGTAKANKTGWTDTNVQAGKKYYYRVQAANAVPTWNSAWSGRVFATTPAVGATVPAAPSGLKVTAAPTTRVDLSWSDNSSNESGFRIERSIDGGAWTQIATVGEGIRSYTATELSGSTFYSFRVRAYNSAGTSGYTPATVMTPAPAGGSSVLSPGTGFVGPTPTLSAYGLGQYADAKAIARWDVVPYQTFDGLFNVGVVAFHAAGIDKVSFSVNGGQWADVYEMTLNPETNVVEYWATLDASKFQAGPVEVRAIAFPTVGEARVLQNGSGRDFGEQSLVLFSNANGTLANTNVEVFVSPSGNDNNDGTRTNPFLTLQKGINALIAGQGTAEGATISLLEGVYSYPDLGAVNGAQNRWLTIRSADGVDPSKVVLTSPGVGISQRMLHVRNLRLQLGETGAVLKARSSPYNNHFWIDGCEIVGLGHVGEGVDERAVVSGGNRPTFYTNVTIRDIVSTDLGVETILARNVTASKIGGDFVNSNRLIINASVDHMRHNTGVHADVVQVPIGAVDNMIVYRLKATDVVGQGFAIGDMTQPLSNVALVNCLLEQAPGSAQLTWVAGGSTAKHILYWNNTWVNYVWKFHVTGQRNLSIRNSVVPAVSINVTLPSDMEADSNHFVAPTGAFGTRNTTGDPRWVDAAARDYRPGIASPLLGRIATPLVPVDLNNVLLGATSAIGALQP